MTWTQCDKFFPSLSAERVPDFLGIGAALLLPRFHCWDRSCMGWLPRWGTFLQGSCVLQQLRSSPAPGPRMVQPFPNPLLLPPLLPSPSNPCPMPTSCAWRVSRTILSKRNLIHSFTHQKWTQSPWDTNIYAPHQGTSSCSSWSRYTSRAVLTDRSFCNFMPLLFSSVDTSHTWLLSPGKWFFFKRLKVKYSFIKILSCYV